MFFHSLFYRFPLKITDSPEHLLTECARQLALVAEFSDPRIRLWLKKGMRSTDIDRYGWFYKVPVTQDMCKTVQRELQRASTAFNAKVRFPSSVLALVHATEITSLVSENSRPPISLFWGLLAVSPSMCTST
jgi:hypothetical protein